MPRGKPFGTDEERRVAACVRSAHWRAKNPDKARAKVRRWQKSVRGKAVAAAWRQNNGDKMRGYFRKHRLKKAFGITPEQYEQMLVSQNGGCAICGVSSADAIGRRLAVDHDHETGAVRGLLCSKCNQAIVALEKGQQWLDEATRYIRRSGLHGLVERA